MNGFYCDPSGLLAIQAERQIFSGSPCRHLPTVMLRGQQGLSWQEAQGTSLSMKGMSLYLLSVTAHCLTACSRISRDSRCA